VCVFLLHIIIHTKVATDREEIGWVMEGTVCAEDYTFYGIIYYILRTGFFIRHITILGVKRVELVSDRMLHIVMRGCR
jgi:hypothetical protein